MLRATAPVAPGTVDRRGDPGCCLCRLAGRSFIRRRQPEPFVAIIIVCCPGRTHLAAQLQRLLLFNRESSCVPACPVRVWLGWRRVGLLSLLRGSRVAFRASGWGGVGCCSCLELCDGVVLGVWVGE